MASSGIIVRVKHQCLNILYLLITSACLTAAGIRASEQAQAAMPPPEQTEDGSEEEHNGSVQNWINGNAASFMGNLAEGQARLSTNFLTAVERLDRVFGDDRLIEDANTSTMTLGVGVEVSRFDGVSFRHKTRARVSLPMTEDRVMLEFNQETEVDDVETSSEIRSAYKDTTPDLGLRLKILEPETVLLTTSAGLRLGSPLQGYGRIRASRMFLIDSWTSLYLAQQLTYYTEDRWSEMSTVRLNRCIFDAWIVEKSLSLKWRERESGCEPHLMFSFMREHKAKRGTRVDIGAAWPETPHTHEAKYFLQGTRRRRLGRKWLFGEIRLGVAFPEKENFKTDPFVRVMVEMVLQD